MTKLAAQYLPARTARSVSTGITNQARFCIFLRTLCYDSLGESPPNLSSALFVDHRDIGCSPSHHTTIPTQTKFDLSLKVCQSNSARISTFPNSLLARIKQVDPPFTRCSSSHAFPLYQIILKCFHLFIMIESNSSLSLSQYFRIASCYSHLIL
jgi:hypothetical protein